MSSVARFFFAFAQLFLCALCAGAMMLSVPSHARAETGSESIDSATEEYDEGEYEEDEYEEYEDDEYEAAADVALDPSDATLNPDSTRDSVEERSEKKKLGGIEEIRVTATKREESIQEVPISMTALSGSMIDETGLTEFTQLQNFVPNLRISPATDTRSTSVSIRGIGSPGSNAGIDPSVGIFIDGIYQGRAGMSVGDLIDIERVEVLRGPQGTLFGKNTAAGAISVFTKRPSYDFNTDLEVLFGNYHNRQFRGSVNAPLVEDHVAMRLSGYAVRRDGYDINDFDGGRVNNDEKYGFRGKIAWDVNDALTLQLNGDYSQQNTESFVAAISRYDGPTSLFFGFDQLETSTGKPIPHADPFDRRVGANDDPENKVIVAGVGLDAELDWLDHDFRWLNAWRTYSSDSQFDGDFSMYDAITSFTEVKLHQVSSELIVTSPPGDFFDYQSGLFVYYSTMDTEDALRTNADFGAAVTDVANPVLGAAFDGQTNVNDNTHETLSAAVYGEGTLHFTDWFKFTGGLRLTYESKKREGSSISTPLKGVPAPGGGLADIGPLGGLDDYRDQERSVTNLQWRAIFRYFAIEQFDIPKADGFMVYASVANGFKSGGFNQLRLDDRVADLSSEFSDEESINAELGIKTNWFDNTVIFNFTGYFTDFNDFQAQVLTGSLIEVTNAGRLYSYGWESDLTYLTPIDDLLVGTSVAYLISRYKSFEDAPNTVPNQAALAGSATPTFYCSANNCNQDLSGEIRDKAPRWTISSFVSYERKVPGIPANWFLRADHAFTSGQHLDVDLDDNLYQPSYHILGLRTGLRDVDGIWEVTLWGNNVTNSDFAVSGFDVPTLSGYAVVIGPPRTYGITLRFTY